MNDGVLQVVCIITTLDGAEYDMFLSHASAVGIQYSYNLISD